ncbi:hypothetical protein, partial [Photorhabdus khanii]|uniref:hypothetical protein n=1 Tax=Photorhabdus khanii TaxID=1004150 RepID=UPI001AE0E2AB
MQSYLQAYGIERELITFNQSPLTINKELKRNQQKKYYSNNRELSVFLPLFYEANHKKQCNKKMDKTVNVVGFKP